MKVFIVTDIEGVSGCVGGGYGKSLNPRQFEEYHSLMMGEINAVVEGCVQGGAKEIIVGEAHPVNLEKLHPDAKLSRGIPWHEIIKLRKYDAALFVGQHARTDLANAVRAHTGSSNSIIGFWINDMPMGELGYVGGLLGAMGTPVVFLSGDTAACNEAKELIGENVVTVEVEESSNVHGAICLTPAKTHPLLTEGARKSLEFISEIKPITFTAPVTFKIEFKYSKIADDFCVIPGVKREDARTISYTAESYEEAYMVGIGALSHVLVRYDS